jgi:quinohemoprotein ethanol dehydrogenase
MSKRDTIALRLALSIICGFPLGVYAQGVVGVPPTDVGRVGANWLAPGGDWRAAYNSPLAAINQSNVNRLGFAWSYPLGTDRGLEATPIVMNGVMYAVGNWGRVYAVNAVTGEPLWTYDPMPDGMWWGRYACCDAVNRGLALDHGTLYVGSLDGYLHAIDAKSGKRLWKVDTLPSRAPGAFHYFISGAPQPAADVVVIGNGGSDFTGARGFISAYDARTGGFRWRFYTVPHDPHAGEQEQEYLRKALGSWPKEYDWSSGGGGSAWDGMAYDPQLGLLYFGTAHASPYAVNLRDRGGSDQLYTDCIIAVHASDGRLAWYYQAVPGDGWDYDATAKLILADLTISGRTRQVLLQANKNGFFYVLDRASGEFLSGKPFAALNWTRGLDPRTHRPLANPGADWEHSPKLVLPAASGAHSWQPMSFSPGTGLVYIPAADSAMVYINTSRRPAGLTEGNFTAAFLFPEDYDPQALRELLGPLPSLSSLSQGAPSRNRGILRALDPVSGRIVWEQPGLDLWDGGVLSTGGNLVFRGDIAGKLNVYAADSGKLLEQIDVGTSIMAAPMSYEMNGVQYVAVMAGYGGGMLFKPFPPISAAYKYGNAGRIVTFKLDGGPVPKPAPVNAAAPTEVPRADGTPEQVLRGGILYSRYCSRCHVFGRGLLPDLRRMTPITHSLFKEIVLRGAFEAKGMARWDDVLTPADADAVHAYLIEQAGQAHE